MDENDDEGEDTNEIFIWHTQKLMNTQNEFQGEYSEKVMKETRGDSKATRCDVFYRCFFLNIT